jgi:secreted PhoX family phosphatase
MDEVKKSGPDSSTNLSRRALLRRGAAAGGLLWAGSLQTFMHRRAYGVTAAPGPYGPIGPVADETTGLPLLQLPAGFRYISYGWTGDPMDDGVLTPSLHDGMAVIDEQGNSGRLILVRNHEQAAGVPYLDKRAITYAADGAGGTTNIIFNARRGRWEKAWSSLAGTVRNCAGGVSPWNTWITCEETFGPGHGYCFEVGRNHGDPTPLVAMGRFSHEALAVDDKTGYVYETEDANDCGFYRFVPDVPGELALGGELAMLRVKGRPNLDLGLGYPLGTTWEVDWVPVAEPDAPTLSTFQQGALLGGARFRRLEGCWADDEFIYFLSTDGGQVGEGQVFRYDPASESLELIYDSPSYLECENPDNITVTPRGGLLLCEDNSGAPPGPPNAGERLLGLTLDGQAFTFAQNNVVLPMAYNPFVPAGDYRQNEWAGACFSPDGRWLFVNIQTPGVTFAITGPWGAGPL